MIFPYVTLFSIMFHYLPIMFPLFSIILDIIFRNFLNGFPIIFPYVPFSFFSLFVHCVFHYFPCSTIYVSNIFSYFSNFLPLFSIIFE